MNKNKVPLNLGLIKGTNIIHNIEGYIFNRVIDTEKSQLEDIEIEAFESIYNICFHHYKNGEDGYLFKNDPDFERIDKNILVNLKKYF